MELAHLAEHRRQVLTRKGSVFTAQNAPGILAPSLVLAEW
jgi:hypothetical protein